MMLLLFLIIVVSYGALGLLSDFEFDILFEIYNATNGESWQWSNVSGESTKWNFTNYPHQNDTDPCSQHWQGIVCSEGQIQEVVSLSLPGHNMTGMLPESIWSLTALTTLIMNDNKISGSLSPLVSNCSILQILDLSSNLFSSSLPDIGDLMSLTSLALGNNNFVENIPPRIFNLTNLVYLNLQYNYLTGNLYLESMTALVTAVVPNNKFSGTLSSGIGLLQSLSYLSLAFNQLSGPVPSSLGGLSQLQYLLLQNNAFTSSLPATLSEMPSIVVLVVANNALTGELNPLFNGSIQTNLSYIDFSGNTFSGSVPSSVFALPSIKGVTMGKNCFSGTLPENICDAKGLTTVKLNNLAGLYGNTVNQSDAGLTASCPLNYTPQVTFSYRNWTTGNPETFLLYNGVGPPGIGGKIRPCLFNLPNLTNLYLAGNGFSGSLPASISPSLVNISVSSNHLTGTISAAIQLKGDIVFLDVSNNKLNGTINYFQRQPNSTIKMFDNRLSGWTPLSFNDVSGGGGVQVLTGNVFQYIPGYPLPQSDPNYPTYSSGSSQLDIATYILLSILAVVTVAVSCFVWTLVKHKEMIYGKENLSLDNGSGNGSGSGSGTEVGAGLGVGIGGDVSQNASGNIESTVKNIENCVIQLGQWMRVPESAKNESEPVGMERNSTISMGSFSKYELVPGVFEIKFCTKLLRKIRRTMIMVGLMSTIMGTVCNPLLKQSFSTHKWQYGFIVTLAYMEGTTPVIVVIVALCLTMGLLIWTLVVRIGFSVDGIIINFDIEKQIQEEMLKYNQIRSLSQRVKDALKIVLFGWFDFTVLLTFNVYYVVSIQNLGTEIDVIGFQLCLSFIKVLFNVGLVPMFLRYLAYSSSPDGVTTNDSAFFMTMRSLFFCTNNVFIPCVATAITDTTCFYFLFVGNDSEISGSEYPACSNFDIISGQCTEISFYSTAIPYITAFTYNNQCSSALLANYLPVFLYASIINLAFAALGSFAIARIKKSIIPGFVVSLLPNLMWPAEVNDGGRGELVVMDGIVASIMGNFIILFTFGFAAPVLAAATMWTAILSTFEWQILFGRYMDQYAKIHGNAHTPLNSPRFSANVVGVWKGVQNSVWVAVFAGGLFYGFLCSDLSGGITFNGGSYDGWWPLLVTVLTPTVAWIVVAWSKRSFICSDVYNRSSEQTTAAGSGPGPIQHQNSGEDWNASRASRVSQMLFPSNVRHLSVIGRESLMNPTRDSAFDRDSSFTASVDETSRTHSRNLSDTSNPLSQWQQGLRQSIEPIEEGHDNEATGVRLSVLSNHAETPIQPDSMNEEFSHAQDRI